MARSPQGELGPDPGARPRAERPEDIEQDIRRTRAEMSETIDEIEYRLSPQHIKQEIRSAIRDTVDEVQERLRPQRVAQRAGESMLDTVKEHPVPSLIAGLSVGYLLMKSGAETARRTYRDRPSSRRRPVRGEMYERGYAQGGYYPEAYYPEGYGRYYEGAPRSTQAYGEEAYGEEEEHSRGEGITSRAREAASRTREAGRSATERASEVAGEARERASEWAGEAQHQAQAMGRRVQRGARRTQNQVEAFVDRSPMVAGVVALGAGALLGSMVPATRTEDQWMGSARDEFMHRAEEATEQTMERARDVAERVGEEAERAARDVQETAKEGARDVREEAQHQAKEKSKPSGQ